MIDVKATVGDGGSQRHITTPWQESIETVGRGSHENYKTVWIWDTENTAN